MNHEWLKGRKKLVSDINVVPYIDVMLVLLVVFMVTAPLLTQGLDIQLPQVQSDPIPTQEKPVVLSINQQKQLFLNLNQSKQPQSFDEIIERLKREVYEKPDTQVLIEAHKELPYGEVIELMAKLKEQKIYRFGLLTEPLPDNAM
jgi:biopolymer transport protein TolR